jgi:hypothetical protein
MSGAGGAPFTNNFNASQDCQGNTLAPGASCHMFYTFTPTSTGPLSDDSTGDWNGQNFDIKLKGEGQNGCTVATRLIGNAALNSSAVDTDAAGLAEAFRATATGTGTANVLCIFLDPSDTTTTLVAGIYADASGHPGALLASGRVVGAAPGSFATIPLPPVALSSGTPYWIAMLSPAGSSGTLEFRDHCCGLQSATPSGPSENSRETNLTSLPAIWTSGARWPHDGPLLGWGGG